MIRSATADDTKTIGDLIRALAEYEGLSHLVTLADDRLRDHLFGPRPFAEVLLAEDAGEVVGFAAFFRSYSTFLGEPGMYLEDLFVRQAHRGKGHGRALLAAVARRAVEQGCAQLRWSVLDWNESSIAFYRALGAVPLAEWTTYRLAGDALAALAGRAGR